MRLKWTMGIIFLFIGCLNGRVAAQEIAVKTNVPYWATVTPNLGVEMALGSKWTLDVSGGYNPWTFSDNMKWKHWLVQPELRYWLCEKMGGHFFGVHALGGQYNIGNVNTNLNLLGSDFSMLKDHRFEGWFAGAGLAYGYAWMLGRHLNLEAELGLGWAYSRYDRFQCVTCGSKEVTDKSHNYVGPTKAAINLVYVF